MTAAPNSESASILPNAQTPTVFLVQANPYRNDFQIIFASGPICNVRAEVNLTPIRKFAESPHRRIRRNKSRGLSLPTSRGGTNASPRCRRQWAARHE